METQNVFDVSEFKQNVERSLKRGMEARRGRGDTAKERRRERRKGGMRVKRGRQATK